MLVEFADSVVELIAVGEVPAFYSAAVNEHTPATRVSARHAAPGAQASAVDPSSNVVRSSAGCLVALFCDAHGACWFHLAQFTVLIQSKRWLVTKLDAETLKDEVAKVCARCVSSPPVYCLDVAHSMVWLS